MVGCVQLVTEEERIHTFCQTGYLRGIHSSSPSPPLSSFSVFNVFSQNINARRGKGGGRKCLRLSFSLVVRRYLSLQGGTKNIQWSGQKRNCINYWGVSDLETQNLYLIYTCLTGEGAMV